MKLQAQFGKWTAPVVAPFIQATVQGGKRSKPTHFLSLRLKSPNLWKHAGMITMCLSLRRVHSGEDDGNQSDARKS